VLPSELLGKSCASLFVLQVVLTCSVTLRRLLPRRILSVASPKSVPLTRTWAASMDKVCEPCKLKIFNATGFAAFWRRSSHSYYRQQISFQISAMELMSTSSANCSFCFLIRQHIEGQFPDLEHLSSIRETMSPAMKIKESLLDGVKMKLRLCFNKEDQTTDVGSLQIEDDSSKGGYYAFSLSQYVQYIVSGRPPWMSCSLCG